MIKRLSLLLALSILSMPSLAAIDLTTVSGWSTVLQGAGLDNGNDQQATASIDLLGDASYPMFWMEFDENLPGDPSDDEVGFSFRGDKVVDNQGDFKGYLWIGLDFDNDGKIDTFMVLNGDGTASGQTLTVYDSDPSKLNNSPSTTSLISGTATPVTTGFSFYHALATDIVNIDADTDDDYIVSYKVNLPALATALNTMNLSDTGQPLSTLDGGNGVGVDTPFKLVVSSAQQVNSLNGDLGGYDAADSDGAVLYTAKGAFTPTITYSDPDPFDAAQSTIIASPTTVAADGVTTSTITVQAKDSAGNNLPNSAGTLTLSQDGSASLSSVTDNNDGTYTATITSTTIESVTISGTIDGAGIADTASVSFTDITPPSVSINNVPAAINDTAFNVTIEFSEDVTGFVSGDVSVANGSVTGFVPVDGNTYTVEITPSGAGNMTIDVAANVAQDGAGNNNTVAIQAGVSYDVTAPTVDIQGEPVTVNSTAAFNVTVEFSEDVTGFLSGDVSVGNGSVTSFTPVDGNTYTVEITPDGAGVVTIDVAVNVAQDGAGNDNTAATQAVVGYDVIQPTVDIQGEPAIINSAAAFNVTVEFSENVTGFVSGDVSVGNGSVTGFTPVDGNTYTVEVTPNGAGDVTIDVAANVAADNAGNSNIAATQASVSYDATAPTVDIQGEPVTVNSTAAFNVTVEFSEDVTGFLSGDVSVGNGSVTGFTAVDGNTYTVEITPSGAGNITIDVAANVAQDGAGNNNVAATQASITYDGGAPSADIQGEPVTVNSTTAFNVTVEFSENVTGFVSDDVSVGNGSVTGFTAVDGNTYIVEVTPSGAGDVTVDVAANVAQDGAGNNNTAAARASVIYDATAPTVDIQGEPATVNSTAAFNVTVEFSEDVTGFVSGDVSVGNGSVTGFTTIDGNTYTVQITPSGAGNVTIDVAANVAQDGAGNNNAAATQASITYDAGAPSVDIQGEPVIVNSVSAFNVTFQFSETVTGFVLADISVGNGSASNFVAVDGDTYTADITPSSTGDITIDVAANVAQDGSANGNTAATQASITYDATAPTVDIQGEPSSVNSTAAFNITVEFSEDVTGFVSGDVSVGNSGVTAFTPVDGNTYTVQITPSGAGDVTIDVAASVAQDGSANGNTAAAQALVVYDATAPTVDIQGEPATANSTAAFNVTVEFSEDVTGFVSGDVSVGNGSVTGFTAVDGNTYIVQITPGGAGDVTIDVAANIATDSAGNNNTAASQASVTYDATAPTVDILGEPTTVNSTAAFNVTVEFSEDVTGFVSGDVSVGNGSVTGFTAVDDNTYTVQITPSGAGDVTIDVAASVVQDGAGNSNTAATQASVTYDAGAPTVDIQGEPGAVNSTAAFNVTVEFSEDVTGFVSSDVSVGNGSVTGFTAVDDNTYTVQITPSGAGDVTIDVGANVAQDASANGNMAAAQALVVYDATAPTVDIQGEPVNVNSTATFNVTVEFSEDVTGFVSGDVSVGNGSVTGFTAVDGNTYTVQITPSGAGDVTIDVAASVVQDGAGNSNTAATQASVTYDAGAPTVDIQGEPATVNSTAAFNVTVEFSEDVAGFVAGDVSVGNGSVTGFTAVDGNTYTVQITPSGAGDVTIDVGANAAQDGAGNNNTAASQASVTYDATAPTVDIQGEPANVNSTAAFNVTVEFSEDVAGFVAGDVSVGNGSVTGFTAVDGNTYTVQITPSGAGDVTIDVGANAAQDGAGNNNTAASQASVTYDATAPTVDIQGEPVNVNSTAAFNVTVEFSEDVTGFVLGDVSVGNGSVTGFTAVDGNTYTVQITPSGAGDVTIDVGASAAQDGAGNNNTAASQASVTYDATAPTIDIQGEPANVNSTAAFNVTVEFSEDVTGFVSSDVSVGNGSVTGFTAVDGNTYTVQITPSGAGDITIDVAASVAQDGAGNDNTAAVQASVTLVTDSDSDGIPDSVECPSGPPFDASCADADNDGTPDYLETDSDNDGISDAVESGPKGNEPLDSDGDGTPDYRDTDSDNDGTDDLQEGVTDVDGDGIPDYVDAGVDSDGDGIPDSVECSVYPGCEDTDADGKPDYLDTDSDNDGIDDDVEAGTTPDQPLDTDGDGTPDYRDTDSDNDAVDDATEGMTDTDGDGVPDYVDVFSAGPGAGDSDGDGIADEVECEMYPLCPDNDGDGTPDYMETDSDNDGLPDSVEVGTLLTDTDGDGIDDALDVDQTGGLDLDNDGIDDRLPLDTDGDGTPDYQDADSDNDGIDDAVEGAGDADADGIPDYLDASDGDSSGADIAGSGDSDGDGISDAAECPAGIPCPDADGDGVPDYMDALDIDGPLADPDNDGRLNYLDPDDDNDSIPDVVEDPNFDTDDNPASNALDSDLDGVPDFIDTDSDNDGIDDATESGASGNDADGDNIDDSYDIDVTSGSDGNGDGVDDAVEPLDSDADGLPDYIDLLNDASGGGDSDGDGIPNTEECPDFPSNCPDSDGDGKPDYLEADSDNDGLLDHDETGSLTSGVILDTDGDGKPDYQDTDSDNDGLSDTDEGLDVDSDNDGIPDALDADSSGAAYGGDSDGDGVEDAAECPNYPACTDSDNDGTPDYMDPSVSPYNPNEVIDTGLNGVGGNGPWTILAMLSLLMGRRLKQQE